MPGDGKTGTRRRTASGDGGGAHNRVTHNNENGSWMTKQGVLSRDKPSKTRGDGGSAIPKVPDIR